MELKDFIFTPIILVLIYFLAYYFRDRLTNQQSHPYFIPALTVKLVGAISLGLIYQFYYHGGDTLNYFDQSKVIHQAFLENPMDGLRLLMANGTYQPSTFEYATQIYWYRSPSEYFIIKLAAIFGLLSGHSYSSIAVCFAAFGFSGIWAMYQTFVKIAPPKHFALAIGILFVPSVFFWGSGLMKDTITLGALGWLFYGFHHLVIDKRFSITTISIITIAFYMVYQVKLYILLSFLPPAIFWFFLEYGARIRQKVLRVALKPLVLAAGLAFAYLAAVNVTEGDNKYDINKIGERTKINAEYLYRISISQKGSAYHLGSLDGSIESMLRIAPQAVNVTLFRPYLWEVENPLMFISALESLVFSLFFLSLFFKPGLLQSIHVLIRKPVVTFCFIFTLILAFAVGLNSYNFGTLVRYKIQLLPFFLSGIVLVKYYASSAVPSGIESSQRVIITE